MSSAKELYTLASATVIKKAKVINNDKKATTTTNEVSQEINTKDTDIKDKADVSPQASQKARAKKLRALNSKLKRAKAAEVAEKAKAGTLTRRPIVDQAPLSTTEEESSIDSKNASDTEEAQLSPDKPASDTDTAANMTPASEDESVSDSQDSKPKLSRLQKLQKKKMAEGVVKADVIRKSKPKKHIPLPPKKDHSMKGMLGVDIFASRPRSSQKSRSSSQGSAVTPPSPTSSTYQIITPTSSTHVPFSDTPPLPDTTLAFFEEEESSDVAISVSDHDEHDGDIEEIVASAPMIVSTKETPIGADSKSATASLPVVEPTEDDVSETKDIVEDTHATLGGEPVNETVADQDQSILSKLVVAPIETFIDSITNTVNDLAAPTSETKLNDGAPAPCDVVLETTTSMETPVSAEIATPEDVSNFSEDSTEADVKSTEANSLASFLALPNGTGEDMSARQLREKLVALHVAPLIEPQQERNKRSRKEKKVSKPNNTAAVPQVDFTDQPIAPADPVVEKHILKQPHYSPLAVDDGFVDDAFVAGLLARPNGCAGDTTIRHLHEDMVAMLAASPMKPSQQLMKKEKQVAATTSLANKSLYKKALTPYEEFISTPKWSMPFRRSSKSSSISPTSSEVSERELYKAKHTFIGTISLTEFLSELNILLKDYTSSKDDVCRAFAACVAKEAEVYGFHSDTSIDHDFDSVLVQCRTKLGSKTLHAFLRGIYFDDEGITPVSCVINGFYSTAASDIGPSAKVMRALESASDSSS
ncbi:hypothetical protein HBI47_178420 [Parastagonospora nodorum]|nr:hypothetical protein HBI47_178420 [Parastagonospora nodorum]